LATLEDERPPGQAHRIWPPISSTLIRGGGEAVRIDHQGRSAHARRLLIEAAWRCQQRLHRRWQRMSARGKPHAKVVTACARELAGFVWAIATEAPLRS
jgi:hypothetical protein